MNKKNVIIFLCVIIVSVIVSSVILISRKDIEEPKIENNDVKISMSESVAIKDKKTVLQNSSMDVDIVYPEFQNLEDGYERFINSRIHEELNHETVYDDATAGLDDEEVGFFTYEVTYERYNCGDYVSIVANQYIHLGDGRPRTQKKCYVINANTNATMTLKDVVSNKTNYKKVIVDEINNQAENMQIELIGGNGLSTISDTQAFYVKDEKLVIYFEASEISATAVGELEFIMPFVMEENIFLM